MSEGTSRVQEIAPGDLTPEQSAVITAVQGGRGFLPTPYKVWLHSAPIADRMERMGTYLNKSGLLSEREFEIAIVIVAQQMKSPYVLDAHLKALTRVGHPPAFVDAMREGKRPAFATQREQAVYDISTTAPNAEPASDGLYAQAVDALGRDGLAELIVLLGYYHAVAIAMKMHRVPVPAAK